MQNTDLFFELLKSNNFESHDNEFEAILNEFFSKFNIKLTKYPLGSYGGQIIKAKEGHKTLTLEAHIDEIGFVVTSICNGGFIKVAPLGGIDKRILDSDEVTIHGRSKIYGVIVSIPPHLNGNLDKDKKQEKDIYIDTGLDDKTLNESIKIGDRVSFLSDPQKLLNNNISSKSIDDKAGVFSLLLLIEDIIKLNPNLGINILFSNYEETSQSGAKTGGFELFSDYFLAVDTSFAYMKGLKKESCGTLGGGPMIGCSPILDNLLFETLIKVANENKIPYSIEVMGGKTSTDADVLATSKCGAKTSLISIPIRYMHTPVEVVNLDDILNTKNLILSFIKEIDKENNND